MSARPTSPRLADGFIERGASVTRLEAFVDAAVYLDLWGKVLPNWRKSDSAVRRFGYRLHDDPST